MSDMEAVKVTLQRMAPLHESCHLKAVQEIEDDYDRHLYCEKNKLKYLNGVIYSATIEELDPYGFITKTENENGSTEIVALWYNGGASLNEILEEGLRNDV